MFQHLSRRATFLSAPRVVILAVVIAVGLSLIVGASLVTAQFGEPGDSPTVQSYQGCVNTHSGRLRIVGAGEQCQDHEMPIQLGGSASDAALVERIEELEGQNSALLARIEALETNQVQIPACLTTAEVNGQERDDIVFEGCNVHVHSGTGATDATVNGLGNLIVGYNEDNADTRTGSHNLVVGPRHSYSSNGGLVAGDDNSISGSASSVTGGQYNAASGDGSSVSGGYINTASGHYSSVSGGSWNTATGERSSVSGGYENTASGSNSSVSGGYINTASGHYSSISGGSFNTGSGFSSAVSGGYQNAAAGVYSSVSGGQDRSVSDVYDWQGGEYFSEE